MIHNLGAGVLSQGESLTVGASSSVINGLCILTDKVPDASDRIQISLRSKLHGTKILSNSIPVLSFASISNLEGGMSFSALAASNDDTVPGTLTAHAMFIDLGCLRLQANESEVDILLKRGGVADLSVSVSTYFEDDNVDRIISYHESVDLRSQYDSVDALYCTLTAPLSGYGDQDVNVLLETSAGSSMSSIDDIHAWNLSRKLVKSEEIGSTLCLYQASDDFRDRVLVQLTGADTTGCSIISKEVEFITERVSRGTREYAASMQSKLVTQPAEKVRAQVRAGIINKPSDYGRMVARSDDGRK